jgi:hypothetical protein
LSSPAIGLISTVQGLGSSRYISSPIVSISTLSTQNLIAFGESTFLFSSNVYIGNSASTNILRFYGTTSYNLFGSNQYARTVIAERSSSNPDTSELLLFKANNALGVPGPDNVRVLAAGGFQVDIASNGGVWPINGNPPSTVIRAFTVNSNGNVGIGCNIPRSTLDVNGIVNVSCNIFVNGLPVVTYGIDTDSNYISTSNFMIGAGPSTNTLRFIGTRFDGFNDGSTRRFTHSVIGERIYGTEELSELLIFKGDNTGCNSWGPDRVRVLSAGGFIVDIAPEGSNWPVNSEPPPPLISNALSIGRDGVIRTASTIFINGSRVVTSGGGGGSTSFSSNVGINCNTPVFTLDVDGVINASSTIYVNGNPVITSGGAGGAIVLSCNVGIDCNSPAYTLDVNGCLNVSGCNVAAYKWIALGTGADKILKSSDGYVWSAVSGDTFSTQGNRVAWNGSNQWLAVGQGANPIIRSTDGNTWTAVALTGGFTAGNDVVWNGSNLWVAVGTGTAANSILRSANGTTWTASSTGFSSGGFGVATSGSYWIAVGNGGSTAANQKFSGDGITWSNASTGGFGSSSGGRGVAYNGSNMWVAVGFGSSTANTILYSTSGGQLWNNAVTGGFSSYGSSVTWNGSLWVATGRHSSAAGNIQISLDGMNWAPSLSGAFSVYGSGVVWSGTKFIATGSGTSSILYSDDGRNWSSCNVSNASFTSGEGIGYGRTLSGPLYALTVSGDTYINGALYINGLPAGTTTASSGGSGGGGGGGGGGSALPINIELVSSLVGLFGTVGVGCNAPSYSLDVNGTINASSNVFINGSALLAASSLYSTVRGLGSGGYASTTQVNALFSNGITSSIRGLGDSGYVSSFSLASTIQGLGTAGYVSSLGNLTNLTNVNCLQGVFSSIGVNCNAPMHRIDVNGTINTSGDITVGDRDLSSTRGLLRLLSQDGASFIQSGSNITSGGFAPLHFTRMNGYAENSVMTINMSNGRVGIGCNAPANALDVVGRIRVNSSDSNITGITLRTTTFPGYERSGDIWMTTLSNGSSSWMSLQANGTGTFRIYEGGGIFIQPQPTNVGINVLGSAAYGLIQLRGTTSESTSFYIDPVNAGTSSNTGWITGQTTSIGNVGPAHITTFGVTRVNNGGLSEYGYYMTSNGRFGINCNTPAVALDVVGDLVISGRGQINKGLLINGINGPYVTNIFGNVGINIPNSNPTYPLDVAGSMRISRANNYDRMVFGFSPVSSPTSHNWPLISMLVGNANAYLWGDSVYQQPGLMVGFNVHTENGAMVVDNPTFGGAFIEVGLQRGGGTFGGMNFVVSHSTLPSAFSNASSNPAISINSYYGSTPGNYVGINKTNPATALDVSGTILSSQLICGGHAQSSGFTVDVSGAIFTRVGTNGGVMLDCAGAERMPAIVFSSNYPTSLAAIGYNAAVNRMLYGFGTNPGHDFLGIITASGFVTSSDKTLKENIVDARTNYLDDLNKLRVVNYNRIGKTKKELGFIAQEMEEVFPSVVEKNGYDDTKGYAITALIPMFVSAVQSLSKTVSSLQGQIDEIKSASNPITP